METLLKEINLVLGVTGSFVFSLDGNIVAKAVAADFDTTRLELAARVASRIFIALDTSDQRITSMDLLFDRNRLILRRLRGGTLAVLCARNISLPLLNLTLTSAAKKIAAELKPSPPAVAPSAPLAAALNRGIAPAPAAKVSAPPAPGGAVDQSAAPPDLASARFFEQLTRELTRVMGAPAGIIIEEEIGALHVTRETFPKMHVAELIERISAAIRDETRRKRFQQAMSEAIRNLE
jgi:predicted regulator of Ras-like GTPase activity (Roadblock/LC7/MglB family)